MKKCLSRRDLYEMGEPFGDCATAEKPGGGVIAGGGGDSSSSSSQSTTTSYTDSRSVNDSHAQTNSNNTTINTVDPGAIDLSKLAVSSNAANVKSLLDASAMLFGKTAELVQQSNALTGQLAGDVKAAYADSAKQASGNKNLVYAGLAVVGIAAVSYFGKKAA